MRRLAPLSALAALAVAASTVSAQQGDTLPETVLRSRAERELTGADHDLESWRATLDAGQLRRYAYAVHDARRVRSTGSGVERDRRWGRREDGGSGAGWRPPGPGGDCSGDAQLRSVP